MGEETIPKQLDQNCDKEQTTPKRLIDNKKPPRHCNIYTNDLKEGRSVPENIPVGEANSGSGYLIPRNIPALPTTPISSESAGVDSFELGVYEQIPDDYENNDGYFSMPSTDLFELNNPEKKQPCFKKSRTIIIAASTAVTISVISVILLTILLPKLRNINPMDGDPNFIAMCGNDVTRTQKAAILDAVREDKITECRESCVKNKKCKAFNYIDRAVSYSEVNCQLLGNLASDHLCELVSAATGGSYYERKNLTQCVQGAWNGTNCICTGSWLGVQCDRMARDCSDLYDNGRQYPEYHEFSTWMVQPDGALTPFPVYCYLRWGGWTFIQRREDELRAPCHVRENFYRNWDDYKNGFGRFGCDFWLGNDKIHLLTSQRKYKLDVVIIPDTPVFETYQGYYQGIRVGNESTGYEVSIGAYELIHHTTQSGDSLNPAAYPHLSINKMKFSTYDNDNDNHKGNCARDFQSGWWFNACTAANINGVYMLTNNGTVNETVAAVSWEFDWPNTVIKGIDVKIQAVP